MPPKKDTTIQTKLDKYKTPGDTGASPRTPAPTGEPIPVDAVQKMFAELQKGLAQINDKLDAHGTSLTGLQAAVDSLKEKTQQSEQRLGDAETAVADLTTRLKLAETSIASMKTKQDDLEARSRRNNVRILGLDETIAARPLEPLLETMLRDLLGTEELSNIFVVERAHRTPATKPPVGSPPRPIILRFLNYRDRDVILKLAREKGELKYQGSRISIYPDFTMAVQSARRAFLDVKDTLRHNGIPYSMMYPAKLRVVFNNRTWFFDTASAAETFILDNIGVMQRRPSRPSRASAKQRGQTGESSLSINNLTEEGKSSVATGGS